MGHLQIFLALQVLALEGLLVVLLDPEDQLAWASDLEVQIQGLVYLDRHLVLEIVLRQSWAKILVKIHSINVTILYREIILLEMFLQGMGIQVLEMTRSRHSYKLKEKYKTIQESSPLQIVAAFLTVDHRRQIGTDQ